MVALAGILAIFLEQALETMVGSPAVAAADFLHHPAREALVEVEMVLPEAMHQQLPMKECPTPVAVVAAAGITMPVPALMEDLVLLLSDGETMLPKVMKYLELNMATICQESIYGL